MFFVFFYGSLQGQVLKLRPTLWSEILRFIYCIKMYIYIYTYIYIYVICVYRYGYLRKNMGQFIIWYICTFTSWCCFPLQRLPASCHPRESEKKDEDVYETLPRFKLEEDYGKTAGGKSLVSNFYIVWIKFPSHRICTCLSRFAQLTVAKGLYCSHPS